MDRSRAKRILTAYRPSLDSGDDPDIAEALAQAEGDPETQAWFQRLDVFHRAARKELRSIPLPPGLKEQILTYRRVIIPIWRRPELWLVAACVTLAFLVSILSWNRSSEDNSFGGFRARMVSFALREYRMDILSRSPEEIRDFLRRNGAPADYVLTAGLQETTAKGGSRLSWHSNPVGMVCFDLPKSEMLYMFVVEQTALPHKDVPGSNPVWAAVHGIRTASWSQNGKIYLLATADQTALERTARLR